MSNSNPSKLPTHPARTARWGPWKLAADPAREPSRLRVLLLHGFAGSPRELRPLGQSLASAGFSSLAPLLPGHGEGPKGMKSVVLEDWLEAVHLSYQALRRDSSPVAVIGFCLGGALALATAPELNPRGLVCLSTTLEPFKNELFPPGQKPGLRTTYQFFQACTSERARGWRVSSSHPTVPESFLERFEEAKRMAESSVGFVRSPALVVQGGRDSILPQGHARWLTNRMKSSFSTSDFLVEPSDYALAVDQGRLQLFGRITEFLHSITKMEERLFEPTQK